MWSDNFEVYVEARALADGAKLPAGWEPMLPTEVHQISLASSVKVRKPPKPPLPKDGID